MKLTPRQIQRLKKLKSRPEGVLSYDQFRHALSAPFTAQTLLNALRGQEINPATYHFLVGVLQKHAPETELEPDGKSAAAGDSLASENQPMPDDESETADDTTAHRGSR